MEENPYKAPVELRSQPRFVSEVFTLLAPSALVFLGVFWLASGARPSDGMMGSAIYLGIGGACFGAAPGFIVRRPGLLAVIGSVLFPAIVACLSLLGELLFGGFHPGSG